MEHIWIANTKKYHLTSQTAAFNNYFNTYKNNSHLTDQNSGTEIKFLRKIN